MTTKFLTSALSKNNAQHPQYKIIHGNISTDGYRIHRDNSLQPIQDEITDRVNCGLIPSQPRNRATVSRVDLLTACESALAIRDDSDRRNKWAPTLRFTINGSLQYHANNENVGSVSDEITDGVTITDKVTTIKNGLKYHTHKTTFKHHHPEKVVTFQLNPLYLLDALKGLEGDTVEIDIPASNAPFYITDGTREAVIMPIAL